MELLEIQIIRKLSSNMFINLCRPISSDDENKLLSNNAEIFFKKIWQIEQETIKRVEKEVPLSSKRGGGRKRWGDELFIAYVLHLANINNFCLCVQYSSEWS